MKYAKQRYIEQIQSQKTGKWSFRVRIKDSNVPSKVFSEITYNSAQIAFMEAKKYRDKCLAVRCESNVNQNMTLLEVFEEMQEFFNRSYETRRKENVFMRKYINDDNKRFIDIDSVYIQGVINRASYVASKNTLSKIKTLFGKMYRYAIDIELVNRDASKAVQIPKSKVIPKKKNVMTNMEVVDTVKAWCSNNMTYENDRFNYPRMITLGYYTGMRPAEIFGLAKKDIDLNKNVIAVHSAVDRDDSGEYAVGNTKTEESNRIIPIHPDLKPVLVELLAYKKESPYLFTNKNGDVYNSRIVSSLFSQMSKRLGIQFNMYQLRHWFIQRLLDNGAQLRSIMELCGHVEASTVLRHYSRASEDQKINAINSL